MPDARACVLVLAASLLAGCGGAQPSDRAVTAAVRTVATPSASPATTASARPATSSVVAPPPVVVQGSGRMTTVAGGSATAGTGPLQTYAVEVEGGLGIDPKAFAGAVDRTLADPRSWTGGGRRGLRRVAGEADLRITLASPRTVDRLCAPLRTVGRYSCANGDRAVINVARWLHGATAYGPHLADYRAYVVNHEVGHTLGFGHAPCPAAGRVAPVMLQQSLGLDGCTRGPWPYP